MSQPLKDIKILELSTMVTASLATMMMAEQGASVIKIEPMETGDPMRHIGTSKNGISALFANCNRGKRSMAVDLKSPAGQDLIHQLSARADVLIHNYRPGVMEQLNLGSDYLREKNPGLIYTAISGFGKAGPMANAPAYDPVVQAQTGFTALQAGKGEPDFMRTLICDKITAYTCCQGVTAALYQRSMTGQGQHLDISMLDASLFFLWPDGYMDHTLLDEDREIKPHLSEAYRLHITSDGAITISAATDKQMQGVFKAIDREDLCHDERFNSSASRFRHLESLNLLLAESFRQMSTAELMAKLRKHDVPCASSLSFKEVINHPQVRANNSIEARPHPSMGNMYHIKSPVQFDGERSALSAPCPAHGEHSRMIVRELGLNEEKIEQLVHHKVIL
ncbi:MAG: CoA transferase [Gammaproteobacteria bacterium]|nr:CoA transferase [Gammaproteobacteria bacterium]